MSKPTDLVQGALDYWARLSNAISHVARPEEV
jgi:hypothetical protein